MNQLDSVRAWLEKLCIKVPGDWIEACLEWIQEENQVNTCILNLYEFY